MTDKFKNVPVTRSDPATGLFTIAPSDSADLPHVIRYLRVGSSAGDVRVTTRAGDVETIPNVQIGETIVGDIVKVHATGTTATGMTGWYDPGP